MLAGLVALLCVIVPSFGTIVGLVLNKQSQEIKEANERIAALEREADSWEEYSRQLWVWARRHLDRYYRYMRPGSPDPEDIPLNDRRKDNG